MQFFLSQKIGSYLKRLDIEYGRQNDAQKLRIIRNCRATVIEQTEYDNWNGGTYGHDVRLFLPEVVFEGIALKEQDRLAEQIREDLNRCAAGVAGEFFRAVVLELNDEVDPGFKRSVSLSGAAPADAARLTIWKPGFVRLFISHRDAHKRQATEFASQLEDYGVSAFVAHDTIEATKEWRKEIMAGLETMEAMVVFLTDDFHLSTWTNQEVGFALGRRVPVVSLKLQAADPPGFINHEQGLRAGMDDFKTSQLVKLLVEKLGRKERLQEALIAAFINSEGFDETKDRFDRMEQEVSKLTEIELGQVLAGYEDNGFLHRAFYLHNKYERLARFLERTTGKKFVVEGGSVKEQKTPVVEDDAPF